MRVNQHGFGHVVLFVLLVAVAVIGFAGYRVWSMNNEDAAAPSSQITTSEDLSQTSNELDRADSELNSGLNDTELDADIDSM